MSNQLEIAVNGAASTSMVDDDLEELEREITEDEDFYIEDLFGKLALLYS